jgi:hypothetical protein
MNYRNSEMKIDQIISYFNEEKINLMPPFQRGHVWKPSQRQALLRNMVQGRPIPAIFLYKEEAEYRYSYNILDGKQRLESLLLFVGTGQQAGLRLNNLHRYFFEKRLRALAGFKIKMPSGKVGFTDLDESSVRDFREYVIPTVEITLNEQTSLDEIITLFVDINQQGVAVNRFDIVKALGKDPLLKHVFSLVAVRQRRGQSLWYRMVRNEFTSVLKRLHVIESVSNNNAKVDRMWERLLEIALFARTGEHRAPVAILKGFIKSGQSNKRLTTLELGKLRKVFSFLALAYNKSDLAQTSLATDQPQFYTLVTTLLSSNLISEFSAEALIGRLVAIAKMIDRMIPVPKDRKLPTIIKDFQEKATKQTTNVGRRQDRQTRLLEAIGAISEQEAAEASGNKVED